MLDKDYYAAVDDYDAAVLHGIVKIASKMGISTIQSYQGSKIFEAIGIDQDVIEKYFTNTVSCVGGITLEDIQNQVDELHSSAFDPLGLRVDLNLESRGQHKARGGKEAIFIIRKRSICCSNQRGQEVMICLSSIPRLLMKKKTR